MCNIFNIISPNAKVSIPSNSWHTIKSAAVRDKFRRFNITNIYFMDGKYWAVDLELWGELIWDILSGMPRYTTERFDCDDFSMLTKARFAERYKINGIGIAIGDSPLGYHAWNVFLVPDENDFYFLEPQNGEVWKINENLEYQARFIIF